MKQKHLFLAIVYLACTIAFLGCKKTDSNSLDKVNIELENFKKKIGAEIQKNGFPQVFQINQRQIISYTDLQGNIVSKPDLSGASLVSNCGFNDPDYADQSYFIKTSVCGVGSDIDFFYTVSWDNNIVAVNPFNSSNRTRGTIRVTSPGNNNLFTQNTFNVQILDLGVDPGNSSNNRYELHFTSNAKVPDNVLRTPGAVIRFGAFLASDCSNLQSYNVSLASPPFPAINAFTSTDPCDRNDKIYVDGPNSRKMGALGYNPVGSCSYAAGVAPIYQEVEYSVDNGSWLGLSNTNGIRSLPGTKYLGFSDYGETGLLPLGFHKVSFRYRNIKARPNSVYGWLPPDPQFTPNEPTNSSFACNTPFWSQEDYFVTIN